jgi:tripartite-type tricarboxylate transporter receptor subunit TctC
MSPIPIAQPHLDDGTVVALGVSAARRSPLLPDVPTLAEAGADGFDFPVWYGIWAPAGTPEERVQELATAIGDALASPTFAAWATAHGAEPMSMPQPDFAAFVVDEVERTRAVAG